MKQLKKNVNIKTISLHIGKKNDLIRFDMQYTSQNSHFLFKSKIKFVTLFLLL